MYVEYSWSLCALAGREARVKNYLGVDTVAHEQVPSERTNVRRIGRKDEKWDPADNFGVTWQPIKYMDDGTS